MKRAKRSALTILLLLCVLLTACGAEGGYRQIYPPVSASAAETAAAEGLQTGTPIAEAPETEAPTAEALESEAPTAEIPETEAPTAEILESEAPTAETTEALETENPTAEAPETENPTAEAPETDPSGVRQAPEIPEPDQSDPAPTAVTYVLNKNTMKFHRPDCASAAKIKPSNRVDFFGSREEVIAMGYVPCKNCNP